MFETKLHRYQEMMEDYLSGLFTEDVPYRELLESMRYSLLAGGKRIRPVLCLGFCEAAGGNAETAVPAGAAIEMIHTFSLIHDDLPCMDNSDLRRGRPTNHKVYGEAMATLAGDALITAAFRILSQMKVEPEKAIRCVELLACSAGENGMGAGQVLDLQECPGSLTEDQLRLVHNLKTGEMVSASCKMGTVLGGGDSAQIEAAGKFGMDIGLAFQIRDDMLDCIGDAETLGKSVGQDEENGKTTFVTLLGINGCEKRVKQITEAAIKGLKEAGFRDTSFPEQLAWYLMGRKQ